MRPAATEDPLVLRGTYATVAVQQAVYDGISRHGDDFVLVVQHRPVGGGRIDPAGTATPSRRETPQDADLPAVPDGVDDPRWAPEHSSGPVRVEREAHVTGRPQEPRDRARLQAPAG